MTLISQSKMRDALINFPLSKLPKENRSLQKDAKYGLVHTHVMNPGVSEFLNYLLLVEYSAHPMKPLLCYGHLETRNIEKMQKIEHQKFEILPMTNLISCTHPANDRLLFYQVNKRVRILLVRGS